MRRTALVLVLLVGALGLVAVGCGGEEEKTATPETTEGSVPMPTETTETTDTGEGGEVEGDPGAGKEVFLGGSGCGGCHALADAGTSGAVGPNLDETMPSYALIVDRVTNGKGGMPAFSSSLSEQDIQNVAAYISEVAGQ
jgi:mono/diheme cytochrome c family protein